MAAAVKQEVHLGEFTCSLETLGQLLGFDSQMVIHHIEMTPMAILGVPSCRIVVEDPNLRPIAAGEEISRISPHFTVRDATYRKFNGWQGDNEKPKAEENTDLGG